MAGFSALHLAASPRSREACGKISAMGLAGVLVIAVLAILILSTKGKPLTAVLANSDINSGDPDVLRNMIFVSPARRRIFEFADGSSMMHPSLVLDPVLLTAFVLGIPFLLWRVRGSLAARLLLGVLIVATVVCYFPPISTFLGDDLVLPGQLWRLAWPISLAALLTLGWLAWEVSSRAAVRLEGLRLGRPPAIALPLLLVVALAAAAVPGRKPAPRWWNAARKSRTRVPPRRSALSLVPRRDNLAQRRAGVGPPQPPHPLLLLLGERGEPQGKPGPAGPPQAGEAGGWQDRGSARVARRTGVLQRDQPRAAAEILRRNNVDFVMVRSDSELTKAMADLPGFVPVREPSERFDLYRVDLPTLERQLETTGNARLPPQ